MTISLRKAGNALSPSRPLLFGASNTDLILGRGWSHQEVEATWTTGAFADLTVEMADDARRDGDGVNAVNLSLDCAPLLVPGRSASQVIVIVNGLIRASVALEHRTSVWIGPLTEQYLEMTIWTLDPRVPQEASPGAGDSRLLGTQIYSLQIEA